MTKPDPDPDAELAAIFREEASERLDRMVGSLLALEAGKPPAGAVDSLFRDAHTIKGSAGMLGLEEVRGGAEAIENVLEEVRGGGAFPPELTEPLLRATDELRRAVTGQPIAEAAVREPVASSLRAAPAPAAAPVDEPAPKEAERRSLRVSAVKVDRLFDAVGETVLQSRRLEHLLRDDGSRDRDDERLEGELGRGEVLLDELQDAVIQMRTLPLSSITGRFARSVRDLAAAQGSEVALTISGAEVQLDRVILDGIGDTITHLLRNAVAHGIEPPDVRERAGKPARGRIELRAEQRGSLVAIEVADDGRGVAPELLLETGEGRSLADVLAEAGFSTAGEVTDVSGRGVGLDAVKAHVESLGGSLEVTSEPGRGSTVTLMVPLTLALQRVLLLERGGQVFGLPLISVEEALSATDTVSLGGREAIELRERSIPLSDLAAILGAAAPDLPSIPQAVIVTASGRRIAAVCDRIVAEQEVVVKSLGPLLAGVPGYLGAAILGDGGIALILDPAFVAKMHARRASRPATPPPRVASRLLVVDDQFTVRELQRSILEAAGYTVETARNGREALTMVVRESDIDLVVTDIDMPEMDGIELLRTVRAEPTRASLPIVVVTGKGGEEDRRRGVEAGADAYIVKDEFDQQALLETVERLLAR
jgi:two-component system chemotaxis sensor kinase CheA